MCLSFMTCCFFECWSYDCWILRIMFLFQPSLLQYWWLQRQSSLAKRWPCRPVLRRLMQAVTWVVIGSLPIPAHPKLKVPSEMKWCKTEADCWSLILDFANQGSEQAIRHAHRFTKGRLIGFDEICIRSGVLSDGLSALNLPKQGWSWRYFTSDHWKSCIPYSPGLRILMVAKCGMFSCLIPTTSGCLPNKSALKWPFFCFPGWLTSLGWRAHSASPRNANVHMWC